MEFLTSERHGFFPPVEINSKTSEHQFHEAIFNSKESILCLKEFR